MSSKFESLYYHCPVWMQNTLVSLMGYRLYQKRYTGMYREIRRLIEQARSWSAAEKASYQDEHLHRMIRHCRQHVPYYQQLFAEHGLHENDITSVQDLLRIPILDKDTLRARAGDFSAIGEKPFIQQNTSGSTGTPLTLAVDERTYKMAMALVVDHEEYHGIPFGARRATFAGRMVQRAENMSPPFSRYNRAENQRLYSSYHLNNETFPDYRRDLDRFAPEELIGYPSALSDIATYYQNTNSTPRFRPKAIITNSETLLAWQRERLERVFGCPVRDYYGTAEYVVFAGQDRDGIYRTSPVLGITEVLPETEQTKTGDLVATTLTNTCMPLLRYRVGDSATVSDDDAGNRIQRNALSSINGRIDDYIETPDGRKIGRIDHIFKGMSGIKEAQVIQDSPDHCTINVVKDTIFNSIDENLLKSNFNARTSQKMKITVSILKTIPKGPNGKFRSVISIKKAQN
ncbi:MAG TPA: hypothetical protein VFN01_02710 [Marinobacter sp.]|uniref:phenylacetate--CoA ligase family protein n=1 Tax=Marinobacter sp. TaxID=50741 RepID=UPI002D7F057D|nr:hypothetical protein [Marinobacter sp.]HET8800073.1 hypothetical protein [Marinobacter sp.]